MIEVLILSSNIALVLVTALASAVDWHKDNMLVQVVRALRPSWRSVAKCKKCQKHHKSNHHKL